MKGVINYSEAELFSTCNPYSVQIAWILFWKRLDELSFTVYMKEARKPHLSQIAPCFSLNFECGLWEDTLARKPMEGALP